MSKDTYNKYHIDPKNFSDIPDLFGSENVSKVIKLDECQSKVLNKTEKKIIVSNNKNIENQNNNIDIKMPSDVNLTNDISKNIGKTHNYVEIKPVKNIIEPSKEQSIIIKKAKTCNIIVNAVAGSGKTTTGLFIAKKYPKEKILLLVYNKKLKIETRKRVKQENINNIKIHSFHSFVYAFYEKCTRDCDMDRVIEKDLNPRQRINFDIIIIDEIQDMTPSLYDLVLKLDRDNINQKCRYIRFGDPKQQIYEKMFNSNSKYLTDIINPFDHNETDICNLTISYRLTPELANFVNISLLGEEIIVPGNKSQGIKPLLVETNIFESSKIIIENIKKFINDGFKAEDIFILAPTIRPGENSPITYIMNDLTEIYKNNGDTPLYCPMNDDENIDDEIMKNKIVFCSFHQSKGLERKIVFVLGFDNSYFRYYGKDLKQNICPNILYVATTRSMLHLILIKHKINPHMQFINVASLQETCNIDGVISTSKSKITTGERKKNISVTELIRFLDRETIKQCLGKIKKETINKCEENIDIVGVSQQKDLKESVSSLNGIAIHIYYQIKTGTFDNKQYIKWCQSIIDTNPSVNTWLKDIIKTDNSLVEISDILIAANIIQSYMSNGRLFKLAQINNYNWMTEKQLKSLYERMYEMFKQYDQNMKHEVELTSSTKLEGIKDPIIIRGFADIISDKEIWEIKYTEEIEEKYIIQLAIYMYLISKNKEIFSNGLVDKNSYVYNVRTNEIIQLECSEKELYEIINILLKKYYDSDISKNKIIMDQKTNIYAKKDIKCPKILIMGKRKGKLCGRTTYGEKYCHNHSK